MANLGKKENDFYIMPENGSLVGIGGKLVVPKSKVDEILKMNHDHMISGQLGSAKTLARVRRQYVWPGMGNDVETYVKNCLTCSKRKAWGIRMPSAYSIGCFIWQKFLKLMTALQIGVPSTKIRCSGKFRILK